MINNLLNDPNYTAEQKVQLMQLMTEFTDLHRKLEQNKANVGMLEIKTTYIRALEIIAKIEEVMEEELKWVKKYLLFMLLMEQLIIKEVKNDNKSN